MLDADIASAPPSTDEWRQSRRPDRSSSDYITVSDSDIGTRADSHAQIGQRERQSVIHPIANNRREFPLRLMLANVVRLCPAAAPRRRPVRCRPGGPPPLP
jgi:hypothetical protein